MHTCIKSLHMSSVEVAEVSQQQVESAEVEVTEVSQQQTESIEQRVRSASVDQMSPFEALALATDYFSEQNRIFESRFVALREKVPVHIAAAWDEQAVAFANIADALQEGDARPLKSYVIHSGMELNRRALEGNDGRYSPFGNALYSLGSRVSPTVDGIFK